ncbi:MAG: GNAT family N-acetyltransferase [Rubrobacter sp.]|nr:GNAT family N-acetyltransferase [Rubrobacter sp.]
MPRGVEVEAVPAHDLAAPLALLEEALREGDPLPPDAVARVRAEVEEGRLELLAARSPLSGGTVAGVAALALRTSLSTGERFASIEELHVASLERGRGVGSALLEGVEERCSERGISYVEVQAVEEAAGFYARSGYEPEPGLGVLSRSLAL